MAFPTPYTCSAKEVTLIVCHEIEITGFRNIEAARVSFDDGVNLLYGDNAQGKTNLLEAIYFTALGKSFRPVKDAEMIRFGAEGATVINRFSDSLRRQTLSVMLAGGSAGGRIRRVVEHNGLKLGRMSEMVGTFRVVLFCPEHLSLIQGGPELRRNYLNVALSQLRPLYLQSLQRYNRILKERNALLKRAPEDMATFKATEPMWSLQLAEEAATITVYRARYVRQVEAYVKAAFADMMHKYGQAAADELPGLSYVPALGSDRTEGHTADGALTEDHDRLRDRYLELFSTRHEREVAAGATLWGVHKDDIRITLNGRPARLYASQGQQRSLALAMKLAEGEVSAMESGGDRPVFLFDDVLSELDAHRRDYLMRELSGRQVIMTACDPASAHVENVGVRLIRVSGGTYA